MAEYVDMFRETHPKGRKRYVCCECRGAITPGEIHQKIDALFEGKFYTYRTCTDCENDRNRIEKGLHVDDMSGWGYLSESEDFEDRGDLRDNLRWRKYRRNESAWPDTNNFLYQ